MFDRREARHVHADLRDDGQCGGDVDAVDAGEVHAAHLEQLRTQIELRSIAGAATLLALGRVAVMSLEALQLQLDLSIALGELHADEVEGTQRLLERKQMFKAPVALQAAGDLVDARMNAGILHRAQDLAIAFAGDDGAQDLLARLTDHVGYDVGELAHGLIVPIGRHGHEVRGAADVDSGGIGVGDR